jgi:hypothetical protein
MERVHVAGGHTGVELLDTVGAFAQRFLDLVDGLEPGRPVDRSAWTVGETVAHIAAGVDVYASYLEGDVTPAIDLSDVPGGSIAASNARRLADDPERDIATLRTTMRARLADLIAMAEARGLDDLVAWHGRQVPLRTLLATAIAELAMHGRDVARSVDRPWPISRRDAVLVISNLTPLLPLLVNPETTRSVHALVLVRVRGGPELALDFDHGTLAVTSGQRPDGRRPDVTVSADPVAYLLVAYGRASHWPAIATGKLVAWGRRPWVAMRMPSYLVRP